MAESFDKATPAVKRHADGAGGRLAKILESGRGRGDHYMGRREPLPGDPIRLSRAELDAIRQSLLDALEIINRVSP